jgi:hypothetical protein
LLLPRTLRYYLQVVQRLTLCNGGLASWYLSTLLCSVTWLENSCLAFSATTGMIPRVPSNVTLFLTLPVTGSGSPSAFLVYTSLRSVRDGSECIFYSFIVAQKSHERNETSRLTILQRAPGLFSGVIVHSSNLSPVSAISPSSPMVAGYHDAKLHTHTCSVVIVHVTDSLESLRHSTILMSTIRNLTAKLAQQVIFN